MNWVVLGRGMVIAALAAVLGFVLTMDLPRLPGAPAGDEQNDGATAPGIGAPSRLPTDYIWIDRTRLEKLPMQGAAWNNLQRVARRPIEPPDLSNQDDPVNVRVLAKALVYARTGDARYRRSVVSACKYAMGTERGGRTLALGKELLAYVLAADLVRLPEATDRAFRSWLQSLLGKTFPSGKTLRSTHEKRPNNWGTYAGATRLAIAAYLRDRAEFARSARVFKGWLGDRSSYTGFRFKDRAWQATPGRPVGINPAGATKQGHPIGGVLPDDQRRGGGFRWPPPQENYVYSALQGAVAQAVLLDRAGYAVWRWQDRALLRAFQWLHEYARYPAEGDDTWLPHILNYYYAAEFPAPIPSEPGKNLGWADWTHGPAARQRRPGSGPGRRGDGSRPAEAYQGGALEALDPGPG